ncbi:SnoaL-like domain-containing protein [Frankia sp. EI5c]|uniref:nuclear transport factor 2 family protein n=1 Tax=Frankia sp. EI5c TaxID=683316 RepID=UPI0007C22298|nr:nuclear transport factor 2 family protein [Frankia sp. EI5c]OAA26732.1 SnoaL-like domain-containing protein [Frankia sp. EI5c]
MIEEQAVAALRRHWEDGFNQYDVDLVLGPVDRDIVFNSPFVQRRTGDPDKATIVGYDDFRDYIDDSMRRAPGIRYSIESSFVSTETIVFVYTCHFSDGRTAKGVDSIRVNKEGRIVEWRCHYPPEFVAERL